jgi:hypothetical protein
MHCPNCDANLPADARFCILCGATVAVTGETARLQSPPTLPAAPLLFTPRIRELAQRLAAMYPDLRIDSFGIRDDDNGIVLMVDLSTTLEQRIDDPILVAEFRAWQAEQREIALA